MEQKYLKLNGNSEDVKKNISSSIVNSKANTDILLSVIKNYPDLLSDEDVFEESYYVVSPGSQFMGFLTKHSRYHINIKYTTLAFICLLLDIKFSKGFASLIYDFLGFNYAIVKLNDFEKCVAYKIHCEKKLSKDVLMQLVQCQYKYYSETCGKCSANGECRRWNESEVQKALDSLLEKKVIRFNQGFYESVF